MIDAQEADRLAQLARREDPTALARLYREFAPAILAYLRRVVGNHATADDILHDVFLRLLEGRGKYRARGRFRQWLFAVAANASRDHWRRCRRQAESLEALAHVRNATAPATPDEELAGREMIQLVEAALDNLPAEYAAAFHLRVREGFSYRELAAMTGDPEGTLRSRVHHTLRQLRNHLEIVEAGSERRVGSEES